MSETKQLAFGRLGQWTRGEQVLVFAECTQNLAAGRYKVGGLDENGTAKETNAVLRAAELLSDDPVAGQWVAVRGEHPACTAVRLYRALAGADTFLVLTPSRLAVVRLRDARRQGENALDGFTADLAEDRSVGGLLRGVGKLVRGAATDMVRAARRPPLTERPEDAVLTVEFEGPHQELAGVRRWKQPMVPNLRHGPRMVELHFADGSWCRVQTTVADAQTLTGTPD
ncbi:hypothetical protein [Goodfellowiella coeruleoviolacea]|uniref:Uncharacterized protein n=1 Tax=Goodfellowiella coeruleoviolacea TaxID=334858 RepID=A0AAE3GPD2_9PSEU|nr:hypothetical protein [Goodfellowiella coeruleoviolacea]MCP2169723.1 hypothetical protein [Goodfellowiella coeruleoviolacea]